MNCVILAAGSATRLHPLTLSTPKCLLDINGRSLLDRMLDSLLRFPFTKVIIVVGFEHNKIIEQAQLSPLAPRIQFVRNDRFRETNNAYSLYLSRELCSGEEFLLMDSDIIADPKIHDAMLVGDQRDILAVRSQGTLGEEEIKVQTDPSGAILRIGKDVAPDKASGESIGIELFSAGTSTRLFETLFDRVITRSLVNEFYEASFQQMIDHGVRLTAFDVGALRCMEIDTIEDLQQAREQFR